VAAGFGSLTRLPVNATRVAMSWNEATKRWRALFVRPFSADGPALKAGLVPIAIAVWDGARAERGGNKALSGWRFVRNPALPLDAGYAKALAWGYGPGELGDAAKGKALGQALCVACHRLPGKRFAPEGLAPDLSDVGLIAALPYLRDSILDPSATIVPHLQLNRFYQPSGQKDPSGGRPNQDAFAWATKGPDGKLVSKMPSFSTLTPEQVGDLVAWLRSLDVMEAL
jgi:mono/diheme cytochrome c family protein